MSDKITIDDVTRVVQERDALRAENERLIDVDDRLRAELDRVGSTRDYLQAENERLRAWAEGEQAARFQAEDQRTDERSTVARLEAEVARLHSIEHACAGQIDSLLAENERLKAEYAELNDLYYTVRGLVADGQDITVLIERLRKQIADGRAENERLHDAAEEVQSKNERLEESLSAEIEQLHGVEHRCAGQIDSLLAENQRLWTALKACAQGDRALARQILNQAE